MPERSESKKRLLVPTPQNPTNRMKVDLQLETTTTKI
jgi:hypothetical protein